MKMRRRGLWREGRGYGAVCTSIIILGWGSTVAVMIIKLISKNSTEGRRRADHVYTLRRTRLNSSSLHAATPCHPACLTATADTHG